MRFIEFRKKYNVPEEIIELIKDKKIRAINKAHRSGDYVYDINNKYILKISLDKDKLLREKIVNDELRDKLPLSKSILFIEKENIYYYLKTKVIGTSLVNYINNPKLVIKLIKEAFDIIHNIDISNIKILNKDSIGNKLVHGDFCLPNILIYKNKVSGFIDVEAMGLGDPWIDYSWCIWSFEYNLNTKEYTKELLTELNIEFNQELYNKYIEI